MRDETDRSTRNVDAIDRSLVKAPREHRVARAEIGILADPARTQYAAIANFEEPPFEVISHEYLPSVINGTAFHTSASMHRTPVEKGSPMENSAKAWTERYLPE
jgi:hypothetical protein